MNSQAFKPSYSAVQIGDEQLIQVHCVLIGVAAVILIAVIVFVVVLARRLGCCGCCNKRRPLDVEANFESKDISAVGKNNLEATPSFKWDVKHQEKENPASARIEPAEIRITIVNEESTKVTLEKIGSDTVETRNDLEATPSGNVNKIHQEHVSERNKPDSTDKESAEVRITIVNEESTKVTLEKIGSDTVETRNDSEATPVEWNGGGDKKEDRENCGQNETVNTEEGEQDEEDPEWR